MILDTNNLKQIYNNAIFSYCSNHIHDKEPEIAFKLGLTCISYQKAILTAKEYLSGLNQNFSDFDLKELIDIVNLYSQSFSEKHKSINNYKKAANFILDFQYSIYNEILLNLNPNEITITLENTPEYLIPDESVFLKFNIFNIEYN